MSKADNERQQMMRHVHLLALGTLTDFLLAAHFARSDDPAKTAGELLQIAEHLGDGMTFPKASPEMSDAAAQEYRDILAGHIHRAQALATGQPHDPDAFRRRAPDQD